MNFDLYNDRKVLCERIENIHDKTKLKIIDDIILNNEYVLEYKKLSEDEKAINFNKLKNETYEALHKYINMIEAKELKHKSKTKTKLIKKLHFSNSDNSLNENDFILRFN